MSLLIKYIILLDDDRQQSLKFTELLRELRPAATVEVVENYQQLQACIGKKLPDMIIIHITGHNHPMIAWIKELRTANAMEGVPVIIYNGNIPDRENFLKVFDF